MFTGSKVTVILPQIYIYTLRIASPKKNSLVFLTDKLHPKSEGSSYIQIELVVPLKKHRNYPINYPLVIKHGKCKLSRNCVLIGKSSTNGCFSIAMFGYQRISIRHQNEIGLFHTTQGQFGEFYKRKHPNYPKLSQRRVKISPEFRDLDLSAQLVETRLAILAAAKNLKDHK